MSRNCLLKHVTEGKVKGSIEVKGKRGSRRRQLVDELKKIKGYWKMKTETLDRDL